MHGIAIEQLSEDALLLRLGDRMDAAVNARVHAVAARLRAGNLPGVAEIAPAYASLLVRFDPFERDAREMRIALDSILRVPEAAAPVPAQAARVTEIPVCYQHPHAPDIEDVARHAGLDVRQVIARHTTSEYGVAMLGFAPGFPYLLGLDSALHTPRRATPRTRVPAGSVAIGGAQTGIYPRELPGGWMLIGRTPLALFDARRDPPCLLAPGDRVRFRAIGADEFTAFAGKRQEQSRREPLDKE